MIPDWLFWSLHRTRVLHLRRWLIRKLILRERDLLAAERLLARDDTLATLFNEKLAWRTRLAIKYGLPR